MGSTSVNITPTGTVAPLLREVPSHLDTRRDVESIESDGPLARAAIASTPKYSLVAPRNAALTAVGATLATVGMFVWTHGTHRPALHDWEALGQGLMATGWASAVAGGVLQARDTAAISVRRAYGNAALLGAGLAAATATAYVCQSGLDHIGDPHAEAQVCAPMALAALGLLSLGINLTDSYSRSELVHGNAVRRHRTQRATNAILAGAACIIPGMVLTAWGLLGPHTRRSDAERVGGEVAAVAGTAAVLWGLATLRTDATRQHVDKTAPPVHDEGPLH